jgi:hypothetical protein
MVVHFIPLKTTYFGLQLAEFYILRIVSLHGVSKKTVSDRGTEFTPRFWERLHETLVSYPVPRKRKRSLHTCAQDVQITRLATI